MTDRKDCNTCKRIVECCIDKQAFYKFADKQCEEYKAESKEQTMTDNDIIKALECCKDSYFSCECDCCPYIRGARKDCNGDLMCDALDLINRQKAEIERLTEDNFIKSQKRANIFEIANAYERGRAEAITEFAERLKEKAKMGKGYLGNVYHSVDVCYIDQIAKEMKGEQ